MKAFVIAVLLTLIAGFCGYQLAMKKIEKSPVTVYIIDKEQEIDIDNLPLVPLEELK